MEGQHLAFVQLFFFSFFRKEKDTMHVIKLHFQAAETDPSGS